MIAAFEKIENVHEMWKKFHVNEPNTLNTKQCVQFSVCSHNDHHWHQTERTEIHQTTSAKCKTLISQYAVQVNLNENWTWLRSLTYKLNLLFHWVCTIVFAISRQMSNERNFSAENTQHFTEILQGTRDKTVLTCTELKVTIHATKIDLGHQLVFEHFGLLSWVLFMISKFHFWKK